MKRVMVGCCLLGIFSLVQAKEFQIPTDLVLEGISEPIHQVVMSSDAMGLKDTRIFNEAGYLTAVLQEFAYMPTQSYAIYESYEGSERVLQFYVSDEYDFKKLQLSEITKLEIESIPGKQEWFDAYNTEVSYAGQVMMKIEYSPNFVPLKMESPDMDLNFIYLEDHSDPLASEMEKEKVYISVLKRDEKGHWIERATIMLHPLDKSERIKTIEKREITYR